MAEPDIKKSHEGRFTAKAKKAGMSVAQFAKHVIAHKGDFDEETFKQAEFARRAETHFRKGAK
jgi:hypothetical protein